MDKKLQVSANRASQKGRRKSKIKTRELVVAYREKHPCATLQTIANEVGVTRERVRQLLVSENMPTRHATRSWLCLQCGKTVRKNKPTEFCSQKCRYEYGRLPVRCDWCGTLFVARNWRVVINPSRTRYKGHSFCGVACFHAYEADHLRRTKPRKVDWDAVWDMHLKTGYGGCRLAEQFGVAASTVAKILDRKRAEAASSATSAISEPSRPS